MAGPDRSIKMIECFPKAFFAKVGRIQNDIEPLHFPKKLLALRSDAAGSIGALGIDSGPVMSRTDRSKTIVICFLEVFKADDRISTFKAEYQSDRCLIWIFLPGLQVCFKFLSVGDRCNLAIILHGLIPGKLTLRLSPGLFRRIPARTRHLIRVLGVSGYLGANHEPYISLPQSSKRHCTSSAVG